MGVTTQCLCILTRGPIEEGNYATAKRLSDCDVISRSAGFDSGDWRTSDEQKSKSLRTVAGCSNDDPPNTALNSDVVCTSNTRPA